MSHRPPAAYSARTIFGVVRNAVGLDLGRGQPAGDMDRDGVQPQLDGRQVAGMPDDNDAVLIEHNRLVSRVELP